jgi:hypothetical protein
MLWVEENQMPWANHYLHLGIAPSTISNLWKLAHRPGYSNFVTLQTHLPAVDNTLAFKTEASAPIRFDSMYSYGFLNTAQVCVHYTLLTLHNLKPAMFMFIQCSQTITRTSISVSMLPTLPVRFLGVPIIPPMKASWCHWEECKTRWSEHNSLSFFEHLLNFKV